MLSKLTKYWYLDFKSDFVNIMYETENIYKKIENHLHRFTTYSSVLNYQYGGRNYANTTADKQIDDL